jgi:UDP-galactopyranose mutase
LNLTGLKYLVVGAGFWGCTIAERIASVLDENVLLIDKRSRPGGVSSSRIDGETGIECHEHGTHIFHTKNPNIWNYVTKFGDFTQYRHKVLTTYKGKIYPMPIGLGTINAWYGISLRPYEVRSFLDEEIRKSEVHIPPRNLEEKAISLIGRPLYEAFIKGYTRKQWNRDPKELPSSIITRLPVRTNYNFDYFADPWSLQGLPVEGYGKLFEKMISHPKIDFMPNTDFFEIRPSIPESCHIFYSGPIDRLFDYRFGKLDWRSLRFEWRVEQVEDWQGTSVMNYADEDISFTRIHEYKHLYSEYSGIQNKTVLCTEYPKTCTDMDETYYPINVRCNDELYILYKAESEKLINFHIGGRLGSYRYFDMDMTVNEALKVVEV